MKLEEFHFTTNGNPHVYLRSFPYILTCHIIKELNTVIALYDVIIYILFIFILYKQ